MKSIRYITSCCVTLALVTTALAQETRTIDTRIGKLELNGDYFTKESSALLHDQLDWSFALTSVVWAEPFFESALFSEVIKKDFGVENNTLFIYNQLIQPGHEMPLTPNQTVVYAYSIIDLRSGPMVLEVAPGILGLFTDMWQRGTEDPGIIGPDKGKGGKYLVVPPRYEGEIPEGYFVIRAHGYLNNFMQRRYTTAEHSKVAATEHLLKYTRIYPLSQASNPPKLKVTRMEQKPFRQSRPTGLAWWRLLHKYIDAEVVDPRDRSMMGILAKLGIQKGKPFKPDERMARLLIEAEKVGTAMTANVSWNFKPKVFGRDEYWAPGKTHWKPLFYYPGIQEFPNYTPVYERAHFTWQAYGMQLFWDPDQYVPGKSTHGIVASADGDGKPLQGENTYRLHVPANVPAKNFWAVTAYNVQTRGVIESEAGKFEIASAAPKYKANADGSVDLYIGSEKPEGVPAGTWIQSVKGRSFFVYFRAYGVEDAYMNKTWLVTDFERIN